MDAKKIIKKGDIQFTNSPQLGDPMCICSRCRANIKADEYSFRMISEKTEYRYCPKCYDSIIEQLNKS